MTPIAQGLQLFVVYRLAYLDIEDALVEMVGLLRENLAGTIHIHRQDFQAKLFGEIKGSLMESADAAVLRTSALWIECHAVASAYERAQLRQQGRQAIHHRQILGITNQQTIGWVVPYPLVGEEDYLRCKHQLAH